MKIKDERNGSVQRIHGIKIKKVDSGGLIRKHNEDRRKNGKMLQKRDESE